MNHLTNHYKHKCEQLQEQINNIKKMLNEADAPGPTQFPSEWNPPLLAPADFQVPLETPTRKPNPTPPPQYPLTYEEWLKQNPEPYEGDGGSFPWNKRWQKWQKARDKAIDYYDKEKDDQRQRQYYGEPGQGFYRGVHDFAREVIPDEFNPF